MKIKDCMSKNVCYCTADENVDKAVKMMCDNHVGCIPICDEEKRVVGLITDRDVLMRCTNCDKDAKKTKVTDIMTCQVCCCTPNEEVQQAEKFMSDLQIRRIPVIENDQLVGMITVGDLAKHDNQVGKEDVCNTLEHICNGNHNAE
ncbi:MAG: CBS domain-containing protein [Clostridia bacterium]